MPSDINGNNQVSLTGEEKGLFFEWHTKYTHTHTSAQVETSLFKPKFWITWVWAICIPQGRRVGEQEDFDETINQLKHCRGRNQQVCEINRSCGVLTIKISEGDETTGMMAYSMFGCEGIISKWGFVALHPWLSDPFPHGSSLWSAGNNQRGLDRAASSQNSRWDVSSSARLLCDREEVCAQLCWIWYANLCGTD